MTAAVFGEQAADLSGAASLLLGWRPDEFWNATPMEFVHALGGSFKGAEGMTIDELSRRFPNDQTVWAPHSDPP